MMDADTLKLLGTLLEHGGTGVLIVAMFIAGRASKTATDAVSTLKRIEKAITAGSAAMEAGQKSIDKKLDRLHLDIRQSPALVARRG
jgi:hypothetical protein